MVKYRQRYNWTHRDLLRKSHPKNPDNLGIWQMLFAWVTHGTPPPEEARDLALINAYEEAKTADVNSLITLIGEHGLTREMVPTEMLDNKMVLRALAEKMPIMALVRSLANLTRLGVATPMDCGWLVSKLMTAVDLNRRVIHPINVLTAMLNYRSGRSVRGSNSWGPIPRISSALDEVFYRSFDQAPQTNQRLYLGVDIPAPCHTILLPVFLA